jgi:hypothetical protein
VAGDFSVGWGLTEGWEKDLRPAVHRGNQYP